MKTLVISDIHGYHNQLEDALANADYQENDRLIFLGDYTDRGSQSRQVMELLLSLKNPANVFLRGNHEEYLIRALAIHSRAPDQAFERSSVKYHPFFPPIACVDGG